MNDTVDYITLAIAVLPVLGSVIASYVRLSTRITRMEMEIGRNNEDLERVENITNRQHQDLVNKMDSLSEGVHSLKESVIEAIVIRKAEQEFVRQMLEHVTREVRSHDSRLSQLEHENNISQSTRTTRRKVHKD